MSGFGRNQPIVWVVEQRKNPAGEYLICLPVDAYTTPQDGVRESERRRRENPGVDYRAAIYRRVVSK